MNPTVKEIRAYMKAKGLNCYMPFKEVRVLMQKEHLLALIPLPDGTGQVTSSEMRKLVYVVQELVNLL